MPHPLLRTNTQTSQDTSLLRTTQPQARQQTADAKLRLDQRLRQKRSAKYLAAMQQLDAGGHVQNQQQTAAIQAAIRSEFPEIEVMDVLLGYVSICYLGRPYEVHTLDPIGGIIEHYKRGEPLPGGMEKARSIAMRGGYAFIEVYSDCCRAISEDGSVAVIR